MKKVVFLQNEGNVLGGVWFVNKTIGEELLKNNYDVSIISIRNGINKTKLNYDNKIYLLLQMGKCYILICRCDWLGFNKQTAQILINGLRIE